MLLFMSNFLSVFVLATHPAVLLAFGSGINLQCSGDHWGCLGSNSDWPCTRQAPSPLDYDSEKLLWSSSQPCSTTKLSLQHRGLPARFPQRGWRLLPMWNSKACCEVEEEGAKHGPRC